MQSVTERKQSEQQWILDYVVKESGLVQNFEFDERELPRGVKSYKMIAKLVGERAAHLEAIAVEAEAHGHSETALELYWRASEQYRVAQHGICVDGHPWKMHLYGKLSSCYQKVIELCPNPIEQIDIPFEGNALQVNLHLLPDRHEAPCVLYMPGMDLTKEHFPNPMSNAYLRRGMNFCSMDGPGQGICNLRKLRLTADNYERAASTVLDYLESRPEIDSDRIGVLGRSLGSRWAPRLAAQDTRIKACAAVVASFTPGDVSPFLGKPPRMRQMFMYMTGAENGDQADLVRQGMSVEGTGSQIHCPVLLATGEFDPLSDLEDAKTYFDELTGPKELWVFENEFHRLGGISALGGLDINVFAADWLRDKLLNGCPPDLAKEVYVRPGGTGPYKGEFPDNYPWRW